MALAVSVSRRIQAHLRRTDEFTSACNAVFNYCLAVNRHASPAVINHHQLCAVVELIYDLLSRYLRGFRRLHPRPPCRNRILRAIIRPGPASELVLRMAELEDLAAEVFAEEIMRKMKRDVTGRIVRAAVAMGVPCAFLPGLFGYLAAIFAVYCLGIAAVCMLALTFSFVFFLL